MITFMFPFPFQFPQLKCASTTTIPKTRTCPARLTLTSTRIPKNISSSSARTAVNATMAKTAASTSAPPEVALVAPSPTKPSTVSATDSRVACYRVIPSSIIANSRSAVEHRCSSGGGVIIERARKNEVRRHSRLFTISQSSNRQTLPPSKIPQHQPSPATALKHRQSTIPLRNSDRIILCSQRRCCHHQPLPRLPHRPQLRPAHQNREMGRQKRALQPPIRTLHRVRRHVRRTPLQPHIRLQLRREILVR